MAAVMDLDLNCSPPEPEPAAPQDRRLKHAMLRQEHTFRHQAVKGLHRLYWAQTNLRDDVPFWEQQSGDVLYARHSLDGPSSRMMDLNQSQDYPDVSGGFHELHEQAPRRGSVAGNWGVKTDHGGSGYRRMIDLEKLATSEDDDDVEIVSSAWFTDYANRKGSSGSSETPDSHSPVKEKAAASGGMLIDLNIAQEDDFNVYPDPSKVASSRFASSSISQSGERYSNSTKAFHKGGESSIGSSKGSSITAVSSVSAQDSAIRGGMAAAGSPDPQGSFYVEASKHHRTLDDVSGFSSQGSMGIPRGVFSVRSSGGNASSAAGHHRDQQEEALTMISDDERMEGFDLNVSIGSIELPSTTIVSGSSEHRLNGDGSGKFASSHYFTETDGQQNVSSVESPATRDQHHKAESTDRNVARSPDSGAAANRPVSIPETPQGRDYACPRLRPSSYGAPDPLNTSSTHQAGAEEDEKIAAETLVAIFTDNSAWIADSRCSNNQTARDEQPQVSMDSFEEGVMKLEQTRDDGDSLVPVRAAPADRDRDRDGGPSCGIKLKRGRGMRDFQREILPGLVSLARHEICDDLHAIGYELRKTRRRNAGDKYALSTRSRLPRRCSNAWNL